MKIIIIKIKKKTQNINHIFFYKIINLNIKKSFIKYEK